jgi:hypothetical protein
MPIVPFVIIGELPGERWLTANDENAMLFALTGGGLLIADVVLPMPSGAALLAYDLTAVAIFIPLLIPAAGWGTWHWIKNCRSLRSR